VIRTSSRRHAASGIDNSAARRGFNWTAEQT
jgi:hypothetical protein